jgi:hypothetical protein
MKRLLFMLIIVNALITSTLSSCNKDDTLPDLVITPQASITLNLTAYHWQMETNGIMVNAFANVIPPSAANRSLKVYMVTNDQEKQISQPISFMNGAFWATNTQTDVTIHYRGNSLNVSYLNIRVVIE